MDNQQVRDKTTSSLPRIPVLNQWKSIENIETIRNGKERLGYGKEAGADDRIDEWMEAELGRPCRL